MESWQKHFGVCYPEPAEFPQSAYELTKINTVKNIVAILLFARCYSLENVLWLKYFI